MNRSRLAFPKFGTNYEFNPTFGPVILGVRPIQIAMLGDEIIREYDALFRRIPDHLSRARRIQTSDDDDEFLRIGISGFLENATVDDWGEEAYKFASEARMGEFSEACLRDFFMQNWRAFGLFHCLFMGYSLGLYSAKKIDDELFRTYELKVYPFRGSNSDRIIAAFKDH